MSSGPTKGTEMEAGRYRRVDVRSAGTEHLYPPNYRVPDLMDQFERWLHDSSRLHPVEYAAEAHYRFVAIHPFLDGNGRTGRLLMNLVLLKAGYPHVVFQAQAAISLSGCFDSRQSQGR